MVYNTNITLITSNTTLSTKFDVYIVSASGGSITITLPAILGDGMQYKIKRTDNTPANTVTIQGTGGETIDGVTTFSMDALTCCEIQSYESAWYVISNSQLVTGLTTYYNAYRNTGGNTNIATSANGTNVPFNTIRVSNTDAGTWSSSTNSFTIPTTGVYKIIYAIYVNNNSGATRTVSTCMTLNSTTPSTTGVIAGIGSTVTYPDAHTNIIGASGIVSLTANDIIRVYARASGNNTRILGTTSLYTLDNTQTTILFQKLV